MSEVHCQLDARGLVLKRGTIVDATLLAAAVAPPTPREGQVTDRDPQAAVAARRGGAVYGYKAHVAADEGTALVRGVSVTIEGGKFSAYLKGKVSGRELPPSVAQLA